MILKSFVRVTGVLVFRNNKNKTLPACQTFGVFGIIGSLYLDGTFIFSNLGGGFNSRSGKYLYFLPADCRTRILEGFSRLRFRDLIKGSNSRTCLKRTAMFVLKDCGVDKRGFYFSQSYYMHRSTL